jgi:Carboxypeptidase regulatory-like domain
MKPDKISRRRRHLLIAGVAVPATLFAAQCGAAAGGALAAGMPARADGGAEKLVVSGRILSANGKPLAGARVEILYPHTNEAIGADTDADGRFMLESVSAGWRPVHYRVSGKGQSRSARLEVVQLPRDETGTRRGSFALTLA